MRAIVVERQGSPVTPNVSLRTDWPEPGSPGRGEAVIRAEATALNHMDLWVGRGIAGLNLTYPRVSGCDACGVVESVGEGVEGSWVGRRVIVNAAVRQAEREVPDDPPGGTLAANYELIGEHRHGMLAERFVAPVSNLAVVGEGVEASSAAAFGLCGLTAYSMMRKAGVRPGACVLITGIGGGVATAALSLAVWMGCSVAVTSRHRWKLERAAGLGAALGVHDEGQDWSREVRAWTGKRGVDVAIDSSGKATHLNCVKSLARGGVYATPGCTSGPDAVTDLARVFWNQLRIVGSTMGSNEEFREVAALFRAGRVSPVVDRVYRAEQFGEAYARLEGGEQFGKIVVRW
ncbi:MAG: zinc-binding dehydrogenase [Phycisphaeraceae bacterium]|nr:MAG: zinc-binding dehydrogenase [Phycisphaeraceae bacterium]